MLRLIPRNPLIFLLAALFILLPGSLLAQTKDNIRWSSTFTIDPNGVDGQLNMTAEVDLGFHIYGVKQLGTEIPTKFTIDKDVQGLQIAGDFEPDVDAIVAFNPSTNETSTHYEGMVTWTAPLRFEPARSPQPTTIPIKIKFQICSVEGTCNQFTVETISQRTGAAAVADVFQPEFAHAVFRGTVKPKWVRPGQTVTLRIEAEPDSGWTIPALIDSRTASNTTGVEKPTIVILNKTNGWKIGDAIAADPRVGANGPAWSFSIEVPADAEAKDYSLGGLVALHAQNNAATEPNSATFEFKADVTVGSVEDDQAVPLTFEPGPSYEQVRGLRTARIATTRANAGDFANYSIPSVLCLALLAGFILNFMPCVLPVIGLKIMSFVHQAGEHPRRIFFFNLAFSLGVMTVFMLLAFIASRPAGGGWGGLFQSDRFQLVMLGVVFAFALSFLGVWEIPIPGMSGTGVAGKLASKDGFVGAFLKGILTTLLATPCSGPLLVPTVIWALAQPPHLTYLTFGAMGLGMALPYLVIGAFPKLIGLLPRPGNWMLTFKHIMGFAMLAAAIFLFGGLKEKFAIPALSMALAIGMACWVIGHTSIAAELIDKLKSWAFGLVIVVVGCWLSFYILIPVHELEWNPFSKVLLEQKLGEGSIVFVDFTADW